MKRKLGRFRLGRKWAASWLLLPLISACASAGPGDSGAEKSAAIDPPPYEVEQMMLQQAESEAAPPAPSASAPASAVEPAAATPQAREETAPEDVFTVYLLDKKGYLAPMTLRIGQEDASSLESTQARAETVLDWLTVDPARKDRLPGGFTAPLPEGMEAQEVDADTDSGTLSVDFFAPLPGMQAAKERKMLEALVWSLTELPGIEKVRLSVEGKPLRSLPASNMPVDEVLTRGIGINIESSNGVHVTDSMAVTLYFSARSENGDGYFVPVTRLVNRTPDRMSAALDELMKGPMDTMSLQNVWMPGVTVDDLASVADMVNISLRKEDWTPDQTLPAEMMESLVLTMTEMAEAPRVKVAMNGVDSFRDSEQRAYDLPVNRPVGVNMLER